MLKACVRCLPLLDDDDDDDDDDDTPPPTRAPTGALVGSPESPEVVAIADGGELEERRKRGEGNKEEEQPKPEEIPDQIDV